MANGRTLSEFQRVYIDAFDMSGYLMDTGEQGIAYAEHPSSVLADAMTGVLPGKPTITMGPFNGVFHSNASAEFNILADAAKGTRRYVSIAQGIRAAPVMGDDVFCAPMYQTAFKMVGSEVVTINLQVAGPDASFGMLYDEFWGKLLHTYTQATAANTADTNVDNGDDSHAGGWMIYHIGVIGGGAGTVTISIDDSTNGTSWTPLSGATSGAIAYNAASPFGIVQLGVTATIKQYTRWQYSEAGGATDATFALAFVRGR